MQTILLVSPYWKEEHRWMVSSYKLSELWQRMGYRVVVVCMGEGEGNEEREVISDTLTIVHVKDFFLPDPFNYGIAPFFIRDVLRSIALEKPDHIIVNKVLFWTSYVTPILRLLGHKPIVLTDALVGMTWWPRSFLMKILAVCAAWTVGWSVLLFASRVVFFHPQPLWLLRLLCIVRKSRVIPTGIDPSGYSAIKVRQPGDAITVTYVGRLESIKGVDDFLLATTQLLPKFPDMHIQVVGWHAEDHPFVEQYWDKVDFTGLRDDVASILKEADIFVLPSYSEGLSNALMEAMASGCACIATNVGGNRFLIEDGVSGLLYAPGDRHVLQDHLVALFNHPDQIDILGSAARKRIESHYSWTEVERLYSQLLQNEE